MAAESGSGHASASVEIEVIVHQCPLCEFAAATLRQWFSHLRLVHSSDPGFRVCCGIDGCKNTYGKFSSLSSHVYSHHKDRIKGKTVQEVRVSDCHGSTVPENFDREDSNYYVVLKYGVDVKMLKLS